MNERDTILLNDYFNGLLSPPEAQQVRERAAIEPEFGEEFALREAMEAFPRQNEKRQELGRQLSNIGKDFFQASDGEQEQTPQMSARFNWGRLLAAAASIALVATAYWFFSQPTLPEYKQYAKHDRLSLTVRGSNDTLKSEAEKAYNNQEYSRALPLLEQLLAADSSYIDVRLSQGICLMEMGKTAEARQVFEQIAQGQSALRSEAIWYIALSFLKDKNYAASKTTLQQINAGDDSYEKAQELLKKLK